MQNRLRKSISKSFDRLPRTEFCRGSLDAMIVGIGGEMLAEFENGFVVVVCADPLASCAEISAWPCFSVR
jgi:hypothetical protein